MKAWTSNPLASSRRASELYTATLAGPCHQLAALKSGRGPGRRHATIPAATALAMFPPAAIGYFPQYVSPTSVPTPRRWTPASSFTSKGGGSGTSQGGDRPLERGDHRCVLRASKADVSNPWVQVEKKLLQDYAPTLYAKSGLDGNTSTASPWRDFLAALQAAGKNLTRAGLLAAIGASGKHFVTSGFVPLSYSSRCTGFKGPRSSSRQPVGPP